MIWMKNILPATTQRVAAYTNSDVNEMIRTVTLENLTGMESAEEEELSRRIQRLNSEWDTERFVEVKAAMCIMGSSLFGMSKHRFWSLLTMLAGAALLQHALLGWCPTLPIMRKVGVRTAEEINQEKTVLKMLRKDFDRVKPNDVDGLLKAAEKQ